MPVVVRQTLPPFPGDLFARRDGVLELVINEAGEVESAVMRSPVSPRYDSTRAGGGEKLEVLSGDPEWHARQVPQGHQHLDQIAHLSRPRRWIANPH